MKEDKWYDIVNGKSFCMTWNDVLDTVRENPEATDPDIPFFFSEDGTTSYSINQILEVLK